MSGHDHEPHDDDDTGEFLLEDFAVPMVVTSGDPAGIGPEVTHKAIKRLQRKHLILPERPLAVLGDAYLYALSLEKASAMHTYHIVPAQDFIEDPGFMLHRLAPQGDEPWRPIFLDCGNKDERAIRPGKPGKLSAERAATYLGACIEILEQGVSDAVVTAPICKDNMDARDFPFPGHTEMFAQACQVKHPVMMLVGGGLRVALATIHVPLAKVPALLTRKLVQKTLEVTIAACRDDFGIEHPRIAVCGLNPHAGENGRFGPEERKVIEPAIKACRGRSVTIDGPVSADSVFHFAKAGRYDAVVAMYHDQGLIPVKTLAFHSGVNMTLGLPIVRTSPDHGTAFDIAGKHEADEGAMYEAFVQAHEVSCRRAALVSRS